MRSLARLLALVVLASAFAGVASSRANAAAVCANAKPVVVQGTNFFVTYDDDPQNGDNVSALEAGKVLGAAEHAFATFIGMGMPALPWTVEIDIDNLSAQNLASIYCGGAFTFDKGTIADVNLDAAVAADVFGQFVLAQGNVAGWLSQGLSEWGSWKSVGYPAVSTSDLGPWESSLDCDAGNGLTTCSLDDATANLGLTKWPFYEYLAEKFGIPFIVELIGDAAGNNGLTATQTALANHGTTLAAEYNAFTTKLLVGGWTAAQLNTTHPPITGTPILAGAANGDTSATYGVDHLATKYVQIDRGDGDAAHKCYSATLTVKVTLPAGLDSTTSKPVFYWGAADNLPVALSGSGSSLSASVPWDTCTWATHGYLSLPNASTTLNGANFLVSTHLDVTKTETTASAPTTPASTYGNSSDTSAAQGLVPSIALLGASTIKVKSNATSLSCVVTSTDQGLVSASLGTSDLGKVTLVPGTNKLTFKLGSNTLRKLRVSSATGDRTLTLTPLSGDGTVAGTAVTLKVSVVQPVQKLKVKKTTKVKKAAKRT